MNAALRRLALPVAAAMAAAVPGLAMATTLYETGPAQDSAFVRFVNGTGAALDVVADGAKARLALPVDRPVSDFQSVKPNSAIGGQFDGAAGRAPIRVQAGPGAFATVVAWRAPGQKAVQTTVLTETPDDFNSLRASLAFYNFDAQCKGAGLQAAGRNVALFTGVGPNALQRRAINPVTLAVQLTCDGAPAGAPLDLGALQAGQRYTVLAVPAADGGRRLIRATDTVAR